MTMVVLGKWLNSVAIKVFFHPKKFCGFIHKIPDQEDKIKEFCKEYSEMVEFGYNLSGKPEMFRWKFEASDRIS